MSGEEEKSGDGGMIGATMPRDNPPEIPWRTNTQTQEEYPYYFQANDADYRSVAEINDYCSAIEETIVERTRI